MQLDELRSRIDGIDAELVTLFAERMKLCAQIAEYKREHGIKVLDSSREDEVIRKVTALCEDDIAPCAAELYRAIFEISRSYQANIINTEDV